MFVASYSRTMAKVNARLSAQLAEETIRRHEAEDRLREASMVEMKRKAERQKQALEQSIALIADIAVQPRRIPYRLIEARACKLFGVTRNEIRSRRRHQRVVLPRQFIAYWCCRLTSLSTPQIGRLMGGRDHTTILHGRDAYVVKRHAMGRTLRPAR